MTLHLKVKCGSCQYLCKKHPAMGAPCQELGKLVSSAACKHYDADYTSSRVDPTSLATIGRLIKDLPAGVKDAIAYAIVNGGELERASEQRLGFSLQMGQSCYVNLGVSAGDYLNCWFKATAIGVTKGVKGLILFAKSEDDEKPVLVIKSLTGNTTDILSIKGFKAHARNLIKARKINAPAPARKSIIHEHLPKLPRKIDIESYKADTIASVPIVAADPSNNVLTGRKAKKQTALVPTKAIKRTRTKTGEVYTI